MDKSKVITLSLSVEEHVAAKLIYILQNGFRVKARLGCSVKEFLLQQNLDSESISKRISTIFLDGKPVDDIDAALIQEGSTLALSGAMPGLVGAVMRSGSFYASFRSSITYRKRDETSGPKEGMVRLKLFNIVMKEFGPLFLEKGIYLESSYLNSFFEAQAKDFWQGCREILVNHKPANPPYKIPSAEGLVFFSVQTFNPG